MKHMFLIMIFMLCLIQIGCIGNGGSNVNDNSNIPVNNAGDIRNIVLLSPSTTIPFIESKKSVSSLVVSNNSENKVSLTGIYIQNNPGDLEPVYGNTLVDASACNILQAGSTCKVAFYPQLEKSYLLELRFNDDQGHNYVSAQLINVKKPIISDNEFMYFKDNLDLILPNNGKNTFSFPIILDDNYKEVIANMLDNSLNTEVVCKNERGITQYTKGTMCTILISASWGDIITNKKTDQLMIKGMKLSVDNKIIAHQFTLPLSITTSNVGNLITSAFNPVINPADGTVGSRQLITLLNNGVGSVNSISINATYPIISSTGTIPCTGSIAAGSSCNFYVNVPTELITNGQSSVAVTYNNSSAIKLINLAVVYIVTPVSPGIQMNTNGDFIHTLNGSVATNPILITNTGNITLNNLNFNSITAQNSAMTYGAAGTTCVTGQSLVPNASCIMMIGYNPQANQTLANIRVYPVFSYTINGTTQSYASAGIVISYSAENITNFVVAGNFGSVVTSTAVATWTVSTAPPFVTSAIAGQSLIQGANNLYVLGLSATSNTLYSSSGGIIWIVDSATPGPTAVLGMGYDGLNYYIAGGSSSRTIRRSVNVNGGAWTTVATAGAGATVNSLDVNGLGGTNSYIATLSAISGLQTSTNGATWVTPAGATGTYRTSLWDFGTYYVFGAAGAVASVSNSPGVTGTWTVRPAIAATFTARGSTIDRVSGLYVAVGSTTASNVVYTTTNPQSVAWTPRTTPSTTQLNSIVFAQNKYVAVGNAGTIIYSTNGAVTWTLGASNTTAALNAVWYDGKFFWATGTAIILVSPDGINWTRATLNSIAYDGSNFIAVGTAGLIYTTSSLVATPTWTLRTSGTDNTLNKVQCTKSNFCMAVGESGTILTSVDSGVSWTSSTSNTSGSLKDFACGLPSTCVIVGDSGGLGIVLTAPSLSSSTWSVSSSGTTPPLNSVSYLKNASGSGGNLFVAVGDIGTVINSTNGINWNQIVIPGAVSATLNYITCPGGATIGCVAVGPTGLIVTSPPNAQQNWTIRTSGTVANLNSVVFYGDTYIIAGDTNTILTSTNAITWVSRTSNILATTAVNLRAAFAY